MLVSIIIPVFNTEEFFLRRCLNPFLMHSDPRIEVIIVDDGSNSATSRLLDAIADESKNYLKVIHQENGGQNAARNSGIDASRCEYLEFLDSDDWIDWEYQVKVLDLLENVHPDLLSVDCICEDERGQRIAFKSLDSGYRGELNKKEVLQNCGPLWLQIIRKELLKSSLGKLPGGSIRIGEDFAAVVPLIIKSRSLLGSGLPLYHYVSRDTSIVHAAGKEHLHDIVDAFQLLMSLLTAEEKISYKSELEWLAVKHILVFGIGRVIQQDGANSTIIPCMQKYVNTLFPDWKQNPYRRADPFAKTLKCSLLLNHHYYVFKILSMIRVIIYRLKKLQV